MEILKCGNCSSIFNNQTQVPLILPCGDSLCKKCVESNFKGLSYVKCPFDNQKFFQELNNYPVNFMALEYIEKFTEEMKRKSKYLLIFKV
jgi:hypothetical protein